MHAGERSASMASAAQSHPQNLLPLRIPTREECAAHPCCSWRARVCVDPVAADVAEGKGQQRKGPTEAKRRTDAPNLFHPRRGEEAACPLRPSSTATAASCACGSVSHLAVWVCSSTLLRTRIGWKRMGRRNEAAERRGLGSSVSAQARRFRSAERSASDAVPHSLTHSVSRRRRRWREEEGREVSREGEGRGEQ